MGSDVKDIFGDSGLGDDKNVTKQSILEDKKRKSAAVNQKKRPEGMPRELWGLLWTDDKNAPTIVPTDTVDDGFKQAKLKLSGGARVRKWEWQPFTNPARKDGLTLSHWRRIAERNTEYPFAKFNKRLEVMRYTDDEYSRCVAPLGTSGPGRWTRQSTDYLLNMMEQYDCRFVVMQDRWDTDKYGKRSVEDLKERYYEIYNTLLMSRALVNNEPRGQACVFDAEHERKRKEQLNRLASRTEAEVEEEQQLINELRKIDMRKKERERKQADLQKILLAAETVDKRRSTALTTAGVKKNRSLQKLSALNRDSNLESTTIRFPELRSGISVRSQLMKYPPTMGAKKIKAIETMLEVLGVAARNDTDLQEVVLESRECALLSEQRKMTRTPSLLDQTLRFSC